jgi:hypothetical protein
MMRETDGCDRPSSQAAREKLPPSAANEDRQLLQSIAHLNSK